jgi:hypothetical protein
MKVWCVFFVDHNDCLVLKEIFHSQDKAVKFAIEYRGYENDDPIEYLIEAKWVK